MQGLSRPNGPSDRAEQSLRLRVEAGYDICREVTLCEAHQVNVRSDTPSRGSVNVTSTSS